MEIKQEDFISGTGDQMVLDPEKLAKILNLILSLVVTKAREEDVN